HPETLAKCDDCVDDGSRVRIVLQIAYERAVDLDLVEWEAAKVAQRGITGPEVVHRDPDAQALQVAQGPQIILDSSHKDRLGHFELKSMRVEPRFLEDAGDHLRQILLPELSRRHID